MARHVSEGGKPHDDFGKYITSPFEELAAHVNLNIYVPTSCNGGRTKCLQRSSD